MTDYQMETFLKFVIQIVKANRSNPDETIEILAGMLKTPQPPKTEPKDE